MSRRRSVRRFVICDGCSYEAELPVGKKDDALPYGWALLNIRLEIKSTSATAPCGTRQLVRGEFCTVCKKAIASKIAAIAFRIRDALPCPSPDIQREKP